ncbi:MAG TPA: hypothetical protein VNI77_03930 [Nitrososphaera sp.]|nr:hypothetical protein [Nitrososphaera sp.]
MAEADGSNIAITPIKVEEEGCSDCIVVKLWDAESYIQETGRSAVKAEFLTKTITLQRGGYADVPLLIKHMGGDNSDRYVSVRVMPPAGYTYYPKSVAESTTEEERFEAARAGTILNGGIDMAQFVVPSDPVSIQVGSQQLVNVRFVVPENIPDEATGTFVPVLLEIVTQSGSSPDSVYNENAGIELIIVHS